MHAVPGSCQELLRETAQKWRVSMLGHTTAAVYLSVALLK